MYLRWVAHKIKGKFGRWSWESKLESKGRQRWSLGRLLPCTPAPALPCPALPVWASLWLSLWPLASHPDVPGFHLHPQEGDAGAWPKAAKVVFLLDPDEIMIMFND